MNRTHRILRRGLTLPELLIGTAMLGMIGTALTTFTLAMSAGWADSEQQFKLENASKRTGDQVESTLAGMLYVAQVKEPTVGSENAYLFFWNKDSLPVKADDEAQLGEMGLIEYDPASKAVRLFKPRTTGLTPAQTTTLAQQNWGDPTSPAIIDYFKALDSVEMTPVVGGENSDISVESVQVKHFTPLGAKPMTAYSMRISNGSAEETRSGTVPMRAGRKPKNFN